MQVAFGSFADEDDFLKHFSFLNYVLFRHFVCNLRSLSSTQRLLQAVVILTVSCSLIHLNAVSIVFFLRLVEKRFKEADGLTLTSMHIFSVLISVAPCHLTLEFHRRGFDQ